jgi:hypothetical protein
MPVVVSDRDAASMRSQLGVLLTLYEAQPKSEYRDFEIRIVRRLIAKLRFEKQDGSALIRAVK